MPLEFHKVTSPNDIPRIIVAASKDAHLAFPPTHWWEKDGEVRGAFSNGVIPVGHFWMHTQSTPRESLQAIRQCVQFARDAGYKVGLIACQPTSPFYPLLTRHFQWPVIVTGTTLFNVKGLA